MQAELEGGLRFVDFARRLCGSVPVPFAAKKAYSIHPPAGSESGSSTALALRAGGSRIRQACLSPETMSSGCSWRSRVIPCLTALGAQRLAQEQSPHPSSPKLFSHRLQAQEMESPTPFLSPFSARLPAPYLELSLGTTTKTWILEKQIQN